MGSGEKDCGLVIPWLIFSSRPQDDVNAYLVLADLSYLSNSMLPSSSPQHFDSSDLLYIYRNS